jgi:hypothetical protein
MTYCTKSDCCCCQTYETSVPCMWLVNGVGIVVAKLVYNFRDTVMIAFGEGRSNGGFETARILCQL